MQINSEHAIEIYPGSDPLDLMSAPNIFVSGIGGSGLNPLYVQYNNFIDGISTIHSDQSTTGNIPIFWTIPSGDHYIPSPDSTLTELSFNNSYYFIARSPSVLPLTIPVFGDTTGSGNGCIPEEDPCCANNIQISVSESGTSIFTLSGVNNYETPFVFKASPVTKNETYQYQISSSGTWPVIINPSSGIIRASSNTLYLNSEFYFDPTYNENGINLCNQPEKIYSILQLEGSGLTIDCPSFSETIIVKCKDCLPYNTTAIAINGDYAKAANKYVFNGINPYEVTLTGLGNNFHDLSILTTGLIPNKTYSYRISAKQANWPCSFSPQSGTLTSLTDNEIVNSAFKFSTDPSYSCENSQHLYAILNISLKMDDCPDIDQEIKIICNNCLPTCPDIASVSFLDGPTLTLASGCCHIDNPVVASVSDANPGTVYDYLFQSLASDNVIINPVSGTVSFGSTGTGRISTLINPSGQAGAIIKCSLTNTVTGTAAEDFLSIKCTEPSA